MGCVGFQVITHLSHIPYVSENKDSHLKIKWVKINPGNEKVYDGCLCNLGALGQLGNNIFTQKFGTTLSDYLPSSFAGIFSTHALTEAVDNLLLGGQQTIVNAVGSATVEGTEVLINSTPDRIKVQFEQQQRFIDATNKLQESSPFGDSFLDRVYKTRVGLRGDR
ncbi:hypothetical protein KIH87_12745 [Paraneptunicella aestuarii]|uniref:hypothetical protein n=1 Tax=Paraneptunicella aestuarii TaxID=2831148 RepID=UPI001E2E9C45|nr:hypothetical protein [Paraneptunicella aestuarii]UAA37577.1 hypothetical protein KIH87_12745 [Paraneptunicella aestuarii]